MPAAPDQRVRHLDFFLDAWDTEAESERVNTCVTRVREAIDRYGIYLESLEGQDPRLDPAEMYRSLFARGWIGHRWILRRELRRLIWSQLADDRVRSVLMLLGSRLRVAERLLKRTERARSRGDGATVRTLRGELAEFDEGLVELARLKALETFRAPSAYHCPRCGHPYVTREEYFQGSTVMFGCELCTHAESGKDDEVGAIERRWGTKPKPEDA